MATHAHVTITTTPGPDLTPYLEQLEALAGATCSCDLLPETESRQCAHCDLNEYTGELRRRVCDECGDGLEDLQWGDNPEEWPLICHYDAARYNDVDRDDVF